MLKVMKQVSFSHWVGLSFAFQSTRVREYLEQWCGCVVRLFTLCGNLPCVKVLHL